LTSILSYDINYKENQLIKIKQKIEKIAANQKRKFISTPLTRREYCAETGSLCCSDR